MEEKLEKIKNDVTFAVIIAKLSIPFNLDIEEDEVKKQKLTKRITKHCKRANW